MALRPPLRFLRRVALVVALGASAAAAAPAARAGEVVVVATAAMTPYVQVLAERLRTRMPQPPRIETIATAHGAVDRFCAAGAEVSALALHRPLNRRERQQCHDAGVEPSAIALGVEAAVVAVPAGSPISHLSMDQVFAAIIREVSREGRLHANEAPTWRAVDAGLPESEVRVLLPAAGQAARELLDDRGLEAACRKVPGLQSIYSAAERSRRCTALRTDGVVHEYDDAAALELALAQPSPGLVAVMSVASLANLRGKVTALPLEGVVADDDDVSTESYPLARRVYVYLRPPETRRAGAADRHRLAMLADVVSHEEVVGPGGAFAAIGLVPLPLQARAEQRVDILHRLTAGGWP